MGRKDIKKMTDDSTQQKFVKEDDAPYYMDPHGQMTINKIDSPLGKLAQKLISAEMAVENAKEVFEDVCTEMMKEMQTDRIKKIKVLGRSIVYQDAKMTEPKIIIKDPMNV